SQIADDRQAVHEPRLERQNLTDLDARHAGRDRLERSTDVYRSVRLGIKRVDVARGAAQEHHDDPPVGLVSDRSAAGTEAQQVGKSQSADFQGANAEEVAARDAIAESRLQSSGDS